MWANPLKKREISGSDPMQCSLCERLIPDRAYLERHHLVPRSDKGKDTIDVCIDCGNQIHQLFSNHELRDRLNTLKALRADPRMWKWIVWIRKRTSFGTCMKSKKPR